MSSKISYGVPVLLGLLLCAGLFLRIWKLGESSLWVDEGYTLNAARETVIHGYPLLPSGKVYTGGFLTTYLSALTLKIVPFDPYFPWAPRLPAVLFGTALVALIFFFAKSLFKDDYLALAVAFVTAFSQWEIAWSRQVRGYTALSFFLILLLFSLWRFLETSKKKYAVLAVFSLVFASLSHNLGLVFIPSVVIFLLSYRFFDSPLPLKRRAIYISAIAVSTVAFSVFVYYYFSLQGSNFISNYLDFFADELVVFSLGALAVFVPGILQKKYSKQIIFISLFLFLPFLYILIYAPTTQFRYIFPLFPLMVILASFSLWRLAYIIFKDIYHTKREMVAFTFIILFALPSLSFLPKSFYGLENGSPQPDFKDAFGFIQKTASKNDIVISPYAHMTKLFLGQGGYWLKTSINGIPDNLKRSIVNGGDYYVGAPVIEDLENLKRISSENHGFVLANFTMKVRLPDVYEFLNTDSRFQMAYKSFAPNRSDFIELYRF